MNDLLWQHLKTLPAFRALLRAVEARFYHQFDIPGPILDLGCGDGDFANHTFNEFGKPIDVGFDPWIGPLKKSVAADIYVDGALQAYGDRMPFPSNHFGAVISNSVLEHIPDVTEVLTEAGRVLKPNGIFLMTMPNHRFTEMMWGALFFERLGLKGLADRYRAFFNFVSRHQHTESVDWWAEQLAQGGMAVERWQYYFSPAALHTLEFGHVQGLPSAITHQLTGKWIIAPIWESLALTDRWVRPYYLEQANEEGCYQFILARKVSDGPIQVPELPEARPFEVLPDGSLKAEQSAWPRDHLVQPIQSAETISEAAPVPPQRLPDDAFDDEEAQISTTMPSVPAIFGVLSGMMLSLIALFLTDDLGVNRPWLAIVIWLLSIGATITGLSWSMKPTDLRSFFPKISWPKIGIPLAMFTIAWLLRAWNISGHPWILSGTEAAFGIEKLLILDGGRSNPFTTEGLTNPLLPLFFTSFTELFSGRSMFALRWLSPIIGALTVAITFVIGRRYWGMWTGLGASILLLGNHVHLHYSRIGLTNIWDPLMMLLAAGSILYAWENKGRISWLIAGLITGLSFYFFTPGHLLPVLLPFLFISFGVTAATRGELGSQNRRSILAGFGLSFVVVLPLLANYLRIPGRYLDRLNSQGVLQTNWIEYQGALTGRAPGGVWLQQIFRSIAPWLPIGQNDLSPYYGATIGFLTFLPSILFLVGFALVVFNFRRLHNQMVFWVMIVVLLGGGVYLTFPPQSHRLLSMIPIVSLMGGIALQKIGRLVAKRVDSIPHYFLTIGLSLLAIAAVVPDVVFYFGTWQESHSFTDRNTEIAFEIGEYLNTLPAETIVYLQAEPVMNATFPTIGYLAPDFRRGLNIVDLPLMNGTVPELNSQGDTVFIVLPERIDELELLKTSYPSGASHPVSGFFADPLFTIFTVTP